MTRDDVATLSYYLFNCMKRSGVAAATSPPSKRRSTRLKTSSGKIAPVDEDSRNAAVQQRVGNRVERLENDNWEEAPILEEDLEDLDFQLDEDEEGHFPKDPRKRTAKRRPWKEKAGLKTLGTLIEESHFDAIPRLLPTYQTALAKLPARPVRSFCTGCGQPAPYTCTLCGARFCSIRCNRNHRTNDSVCSKQRFGLL